MKRFVFFIPLFLASIAGATDYYVATTGTDALNINGTSTSTAWKSIQYASTRIGPGAVVHVAPGTYSYTTTADAAIQTMKSGTASARIVYISDTNWGAKIISKGARTAWYNYGNYVDIEGFDVTGDGAGGIWNYASFVRIIGNRVHDISGPANCATSSGGGAGIDNTGYTSSDNDIIGNVVYNVGLVNCGASSSKVHGIYHSNLRGHIYNNISYNNSGYGIHTWHTPKDVIISNNLAFGNGSSGLVVGAGDAPLDPVTGKPMGKAEGFVVTNNIFMNNNQYGIIEGGVTGVNTYKNNLVYGNTLGSIVLKNGNTHQNTLTVNPQFVNFQSNGSGNYHLTATSPAINAGTSEGMPTTDINGVARPQGSACDIGPYEYVPPVSVTPSTKPRIPSPVSTSSYLFYNIQGQKVGAIKGTDIQNAKETIFERSSVYFAVEEQGGKRTVKKMALMR